MTQILLAEDDRISRIMLQAVLQKWGYRVVSVSDGEQALEKLLDPTGPSLAILDWMMPGLTGIEVCKRLRAEPGLRPMHLMLLTSKSKGIETAESLAAGADDHLSKPYNLTELQARLKLGFRRLVGGSSSRIGSESGSDSAVGVDDFCPTNCLQRFLPLNRMGLGVVMENPDLLSDHAAKVGSCDLDIAIQTTLLHARTLMKGRMECVWEGLPLEVEASSEAVGQILLNLLIFFREDSPVSACQIRLSDRKEGGMGVLEFESNSPDIHQNTLDSIAKIPYHSGNGGKHGFGPYFARMVAESVGGSLRMVSRAEAGVAIQVRIPLSD